MNKTKGTIKTFLPKDFVLALGSVSERLSEKIKKLNLKYKILSSEDRDECIAACIRTLMNPGVEKTGEHKLKKWEDGWGENLKKVGHEDGLIPGYWRNEPGKLNGKFINPITDGFDYKLLEIILDWLYEKYAKEGTVYEFGCGPAYHLLKLRELNKDGKLWGLDWATSCQKIIEEIRASGIDKNMYGKHFDFFNVDKEFRLDKDSVVYTCGALEQVGERHKDFIEYLIDNKPRIVFHIEPIGEVLSDSLMDTISKEYYKRRNYLSGFADNLRRLEKDGRIKVENIQRTHIGSSPFIEFVIAVWKPL